MKADRQDYKGVNMSDAAEVEEAADIAVYDKHNIDQRVREEVINGVIYQMSAAPYFRHGMIVSNISGIIKHALKGKQCRVFAEDLEFHFHPDIDDVWRKGDYVQPDIMIVCDKNKLHKSGYYGVPKFIAEVSSTSTAKKDKTLKFDIYEAAGVSEYWIVNPLGTLDIYYLVEGHYVLEQSWTLDDEDESDEDYNANALISLREFPDISMTLGDVFE